MPSDRPATTIRFTEGDREILEKLQQLTGLDSASAVIRMALREALAARERRNGRR
jgi:Arc/MetJ-type ribon-helix-helix transcriptional regulator